MQDSNTVAQASITGKIFIECFPPAGCRPIHRQSATLSSNVSICFARYFSSTVFVPLHEVASSVVSI